MRYLKKNKLIKDRLREKKGKEIHYPRVLESIRSTFFLQLVFFRFHNETSFDFCLSAT